MDERQKSRTQIIVAVIGALAICCAALIALANPVVDRLVELYWPATTPPAKADFSEQVPVSTQIPGSCETNPPTGLVHFWSNGAASYWSKGIWGSPEVLNFTVGVATLTSNDPNFGEFQIWLDPCYAIVNPGHGYRSGAAFWPIDPSGYGKTSEPTLQLGQVATVIIPVNTGKWALGNPP
ncbi:MAG: hypothetical protein Fur0021_20780 [Candidatus Promineifilaceae bacterium]